MAAQLKARPEQKNVYVHFNIKETFSNLFSTLSNPINLGVLAAITIGMYATMRGPHDPATSVSTLLSPVTPRWLSFWQLGDKNQKADHQKLVDKVLAFVPYNSKFFENYNCIGDYDIFRLIRDFRNDAALREELTKGLLFVPRSKRSRQANIIFTALIENPEGRKFLLEYPEIIRSITEDQAEQFIFQDYHGIERLTRTSNLEYLASTSEGRAFLFAPGNQHLRNLITSEVFEYVTDRAVFPGVSEITSVAYELLRTVDGRKFLEQDARLSVMARTPEALTSAALGINGGRYHEDSVATWNAIVDWAGQTPAGRIALDTVSPLGIVTRMTHPIRTF